MQRHKNKHSLSWNVFVHLRKSALKGNNWNMHSEHTINKTSSKGVRTGFSKQEGTAGLHYIVCVSCNKWILREKRICIVNDCHLYKLIQHFHLMYQNTLVIWCRDKQVVYIRFVRKPDVLWSYIESNQTLYYCCIVKQWESSMNPYGKIE